MPTAYCLPRNGCGHTWLPQHPETSLYLRCPECGSRSVRVEHVLSMEDKRETNKQT
jgi:Zn finger protein HypA/HybF involved in hydrogenase expression